MTSYLQVRDALQRVRAFHARFQEAQRSIEDQSREQLTTRVAERVQAHVNVIDEALADYEADAREAVLDTWLQYVSDEDVQRVLDEVDTQRAADSPERIVELGLDFDRAVRNLYDQLARSSSAERVRELFEHLSQATARIDEKLGWDTQELEDESGPGQTGIGDES